MASYFTPSINIIRDQERDFEYILTANGQRVFQLLSDNFRAGNRAFSILGTYGTGKSSFLLAFEQHLTKHTRHFEEDFGGSDQYDFIKIVGGYESFTDRFSQEVTGQNQKVDPSYLLTKLSEQVDESRTTVILLDEFGKFLEYAGKHEPEKELYFLQQLAEFVADPKNNSLLLLTLHQGFQSYSMGLSQKERNEYEKVKGRLLEISFQEPVEQLLHLAANHRVFKEASDHGSHFHPTSELVTNLLLDKDIFSFDSHDIQSLGKKLFPMELAAGSVLVRGLQRYGQNERSLFTFLETESNLGFQTFVKSGQGGIFSLSTVFDYLYQNFYSALFHSNNPDVFKWQLIQQSLDRISARVSGSLFETAEAVIKVIGLLRLFGKAGAKVDDSFLVTYLSEVCGLEHTEDTLKELEELGIIRYRKYEQAYALFEGSDFNIEEEQASIRVNLGQDIKIMPTLQGLFNFPVLVARKYLFETGTPRYYRVEISDEPILTMDHVSEEIDGIVNIVLTDEKLSELDNPNSRILYMLLQESEAIKSLSQEYIVTQKLLERAVSSEERNAKREVEHMLERISQQLHALLLGPIERQPELATWIYQGTMYPLSSTKEFQQLLSTVSTTAFPDTPVIKNELINKHFLSASINTARKKLLKAMEQEGDKPLVGLSDRLFPAEKTIYLSILEGNFHVKEGNSWKFVAYPKESTYSAFWDAGIDFLRSARDQPRSIRDLIDTWRKPPYGIRKGMSEFLLQLFLYIRREDYSLYNDQGHLVPNITADTLELVYRKPAKYSLKSFEIAGTRLNIFNKYRELTMLTPQDRSTQKGFIETVKPFLVFYKQLSDYAKQTSHISKDSISFRQAILKAKDPAKTFFEDFPASFGYTLDQLEQDEEVLQAFASRLRDGIRELREADLRLCDRVLASIRHYLGIEEEIEFSHFQTTLRDRYQSVQEHLLRPEYLTLLRRIHVDIDDRQAWTSSLVQAVAKKRLETIQDVEEPIILQKLDDALRALDNYREITTLTGIQDNEEVMKVEITSLKKGINSTSISKIVRGEEDVLEGLKQLIRKQLSDSSHLNAIALVDLLKEEMNDHEQE